MKHIAVGTYDTAGCFV